MMKTIIAALVLLTASVTAATAATQTNVLQNINVALTMYTQGPVAANGKKVSDKVTSFTTKQLIAALQTATGQNFGKTAKLVYSTVYSNASVPLSEATYSNVLSTNILVSTNSNGFIRWGNDDLFGYGSGNQNPVVISSNYSDYVSGQVTSDLIESVSGTNIDASITINTNTSFITTLTPEVDGGGIVTNVLIDTQQEITVGTTTNIFTNIYSGVAVLYGSAADPSLYYVTNSSVADISFATNSPDIIVQGGFAFDTTNADVLTQSSISINNLSIDYYTASGSSSNNLTVNLQGFVKETLKNDTLAGRGATAVVEAIPGATATWSISGWGYSGGTFTPDATSVPDLDGFLINASPVIVQGAVSLSFYKNLAQ